jgi:hypothetical protein
MSAYIPLDSLKAALAIGALKAAIVAAIFMELRHHGPRT